MNRDKIKLAAFIFILSGYSLPGNKGFMFYVLFGLAIAIWLGYLFRKAHPNIFTEVQNLTFKRDKREED